MSLTHGSLFAGIGGFDLGFERAGIETKWQVEIDPFCQKVLAKHWPTVKRYGDIRECGKHNLEPVDIISGGFPCQDISDSYHGGNGRLGLDGSRSGLWFEMHRIICELRPRFVVVENVPALLKRGMGRILSDLAGAGFDAEWSCLSASSFGAPHKRERLFLVAYAGEIGRSDGAHHHIEDEVPRNPAWRDTQDFKSGHQWKRWLTKSLESLDGEVSASDFCSMDDGLSEELDGIGAFGNAVVPQITEWIGRRIVEAEAQR